MASQPSRSASQLRDFIDTNHIYTDDLDEETIERIREAAEREPEENLPSGITKRKGKGRRSLAPRFPPEWANSKEAFQKALQKFQYSSYSASPERRFTTPISNLRTPTRAKQEDRPEMIAGRNKSNVKDPKVAFTHRENMFSIVPREVMSIFNGFEKLEDHNWNTWKGHMRDNLEMCDLWDIVVGNEKKPSDLYTNEAEECTYRERIARIVIKNALGTLDYTQVRSARTAAEVWEVLISQQGPRELWI